MDALAAIAFRLRQVVRPQKVRWLARKVMETGPTEYRAWVRTLPIERDTVLYESFAGNGMLDNPEAIFRALLEDPAQQHLKHIWVLDDPKAHPKVTAEFQSNPRVRFVRRGSLAYSRALATAGLLFNNATFPAEFGKRQGQVYVNTWHGTPLKAMGYDERDGPYVARNVMRNFMLADYLLSSGPFMTERMYDQAYRLHNVAPGRVIEEGSPRTDRQFLDEQGMAEVRARLRAQGVLLDETDTIVLYAPTWKGRSFHEPLDDARELGRRMADLESRLPAGHRVLVKVHQQVFRFAAHERSLVGRLVPNGIPTNEVLGITDVLVTDYSSIMVDFLATGRPVVLFTPDLESFAEHRALYLDPDEWPGPRTSTVEQLAAVIAAVGTEGDLDPLVTHRTPYRIGRARYASREDGSVTQRVLDVVVRGGVEGRRVNPVRRDERPTLLIYLGGMKSNGITSSALNLLHNVDHDYFDVSVIYNLSTDPECVANARRIDPRVRQFIRLGGLGGRKHLYLAQRRVLSGRAPRTGSSRVEEVDAVLLEEWQRTLGTARFDHVIDFSGYSPLWARFVANAPAGSRSIWLHNDLRADQMRRVHGRRPHQANLRGVFFTYSRYDHLVSVSESLRDINARSLSGWAPSDRFVAARNTIDQAGIHAKAAVEPAGDVVDFLVGGAIFVTVGRISPEKNHLRLLEAFAVVNQEHPETRLVIIGEGPLLDRVRARVDGLGLSDAVLITGGLENPWAVMRRCDWFVLSSDYEGQPMVILEARTLGLPVVTTSFGSVVSAVPDGHGLVVERSVSGLAEGMRRALAGTVPSPVFDPVAYNLAAMREFSQAIGEDVARRERTPSAT